MVTITEEPDESLTNPSQPRPRKSSSTSKPPPIAAAATAETSKTPPSRTPNPFTFWFYFTLIVSIVTYFFASLPSLSPQDPKSWFLSLPTSLRHHYSKGRLLKVQINPNLSPIEVFAIENGSKGSENVVVVHGLGLSSYSFRKVLESLGSKGVHAVAFDLPGNGFSDKSTAEIDESSNGVLGRLLDVYNLIQEKGVFWAFDQIVETGQIPYEEIQKHVPKRKILKPIGLGPEEIGSILGQIIDTIGLAPVHLVLHDSALSMAGYWVAENSGSVRSLTLIDTLSKPSIPLWLLELPVVREVVLGSSFVYSRLINLCCSKGNDVALDVEAHRVLLKGRGGRRAVVSMGKKLNHSFDIAEWGGLDDLKSVPIQVIWSNGWSNEWSAEGRRVADMLPQASFVTHSGGRWAQEDAADVVADSIAQFVSTLPPTVIKTAEEPIPEHVQEVLDGSGNSDGHHHHDHGTHDHIHGGGYMDGYGLGGHSW
ncbi:protein AUXIN RESPONSE 4 [Momordica charantia]|uniref:Protein AUXIN RESPONSE 4 n=1 Tax=Momordica charantia TaxID=3673 RepID=A0A6J1CW32_MOMCH|nr:protein AUXIN RESPONSE 4 [Momordica charantia]